MIFSLIYLIFVGSCIFIFNISIEILGIYIILSTLTFIIYALDKKAAQKGKWRTKESTLHLLSLLGGWPGALIAQRKLRHKSAKQPFKTILWITIICNCSLFVYTLTPNSSEYIQELISKFI